jgi:hypothetical protein
MFVNKEYWLLAVLLCSFPAMSESWTTNIGGKSGAAQTWVEVTCDPGGGWRECRDMPTTQVVCEITGDTYYLDRGFCPGSVSPRTQWWIDGVMYSIGTIPSRYQPVSIGSLSHHAKPISCGKGEVAQPTYYQICYTKTIDP